MDVKTTFLNGYLKKDILMEQLNGFESSNANQVCKLKNSIYSLKQALRSWNICFDSEIKEFGFIRNPNKPCIYKNLVGARELS